MKILRNELKNELHIRTQKNFPQEGVEFIDIMPLIIQKETFKEIVDKFVEEIKGLTVVELNDLVKKIEEEFGVSAAAMVAAAPAAGGAAAAEEKTEFNVILKEAGAEQVG